MLTKYRFSLILMALIISNLSFAYERQVAITIDDLPFVGVAKEERFLSIMQPLIDNNIPVTGFVIAGSIAKGQWSWLEQFQQAGFVLGNHTYSHPSLDAISAKKYMDEIQKADKILAPLMSSSPKYFRYPFLAEGRGEKRRQVQKYLAANNYVIAPVMIDSKDFVFNAKLYTVPARLRLEKIKQIKPKYLAYIWRETMKNRSSKPILLLHANLLNSYCMGEIIEMYKKHGYHFISLGEALNQQSTKEVAAEDSFEDVDAGDFEV
ncbi:MAG: polysaccharide deacetylase family protein [Tatlockia sp.]|nr:polysaccharide deacetylase family protein [Tatlockia sp.]